MHLHEENKTLVSSDSDETMNRVCINRVCEVETLAFCLLRMSISLSCFLKPTMSSDFCFFSILFSASRFSLLWCSSLILSLFEIIKKTEISRSLIYVCIIINYFECSWNVFAQFWWQEKLNLEISCFTHISILWLKKRHHLSPQRFSNK